MTAHSVAPDRRSGRKPHAPSGDEHGRDRVVGADHQLPGGARIFTVHDLLHCTREDLLSISNFGEKTLEEVYKALEGVGFYRRTRRVQTAGAA